MKAGFGFQWFPAMDGKAAWSRHQIYVVNAEIPVVLTDGHRDISLVFDGQDIFELWKKGLLQIDMGVPNATVRFDEKTQSLEFIVTVNEGEKGYAVEVNALEMELEIWCQQIFSSIERQLDEIVYKTLQVMKVLSRLGFDVLPEEGLVLAKEVRP